MIEDKDAYRAKSAELLNKTEELLESIVKNLRFLSKKLQNNE